MNMFLKSLMPLALMLSFQSNAEYAYNSAQDSRNFENVELEHFDLELDYQNASYLKLSDFNPFTIIGNVLSRVKSIASSVATKAINTGKNIFSKIKKKLQPVLNTIGMVLKPVITIFGPIVDSGLGLLADVTDNSFIEKVVVKMSGVLGKSISTLSRTVGDIVYNLPIPGLQSIGLMISNIAPITEFVISEENTDHFLGVISAGATMLQSINEAVVNLAEGGDDADRATSPDAMLAGLGMEKAPSVVTAAIEAERNRQEYATAVGLLLNACGKLASTIKKGPNMGNEYASKSKEFKEAMWQCEQTMHSLDKLDKISADLEN